MSRVHDFETSLKKSHAAEDLPFWKEIYPKAFPTLLTMTNHREDGDHQRNGIDRSLLLENSKQVLVDEKTRWRNEDTGKIYDDILLEYVSSTRSGAPGWVCKPLLCDYIAYAIAPLGTCYLLPVPQLQSVWVQNSKVWLQQAGNEEFIRDGQDYAKDRNGRRIKRRICRALNKGYVTLNVNVTPKELFLLIGRKLRIAFEPCEGEPTKQSPNNDAPT